MCRAYAQLRSLAKTGGERQGGKAEIKKEGKIVYNCSRMMIKIREKNSL